MVKDKVAEAEWKYLDEKYNDGNSTLHRSYVDRQQVYAVIIRKHGGGMRKLLKQ